MFPKANPVRSEAYRRLVAALPCIFCGIEGHSQAAHPPPTGKGIKESDLTCFPLCCARPGVVGCHSSFDSYALFNHDETRMMALHWAAQTREVISNNGDMPKGFTC
tara:strand:- start:471 stop:788 length:318 start_codon:yes stop_codon:yes gene_type:complete